MNELRVTRLLQNPLGHVAPAGARGDIVRVSDGRATIYLDPETFDTASEAELRTALARSTRSTTG
jgi:ribosomal protein L9